MTRTSLFAATVLLAWPSLADAQSASLRDEVYDLAAIEADHDVCDFPLTEEQQDVMAQRRDTLIAQGQVSESELTSLQAQLTAALRRQKAEGLCRPAGPEADLYRKRLARIGLL